MDRAGSRRLPHHHPAYRHRIGRSLLDGTVSTLTWGAIARERADVDSDFVADITVAAIVTVCHVIGSRLKVDSPLDGWISVGTLSEGPLPPPSPPPPRTLSLGSLIPERALHFEPAGKWEESRPETVFKRGQHGVGYYHDFGTPSVDDSGQPGPVTHGVVPPVRLEP